jgi:cytochrome subunit of sulfide dehydrogenase
MKPLLKNTAATLVGAFCVLASAETVDTQARAWAASCAACHGTHGKGASSGIPSIAGQSKEVLLQKLLAFKRDQLPATVMHQHAKGYTDAELARIAAHLAQVNR